MFVSHATPWTGCGTPNYTLHFVSATGVVDVSDNPQTPTDFPTDLEGISIAYISDPPESSRSYTAYTSFGGDAYN